MTATLGYCTNVHAGATLAQAKEQLDRHATAVRRELGVEWLDIGLWLSARSVFELKEQASGVERLRAWLDERGLRVFTINGFPYGDFHADRVKQAVYEPNWANARRLLFSIDLADILVGLVHPGRREAGISTLPLGWRLSFSLEGCGSSVGLASAQLEQFARHAQRLEDRTGICVHLDLEPEPGCMLDTSRDVTGFFDQVLRRRAGEPDLRRYIRVCHDTCHAAVMFEDQADVLKAYRDAGVRVGKVQLSSAIECPSSDRAFRALRHFDEPVYLHQTCVLDGAGERHLYTDLDRAFDHAPDGLWRTHFHVPLYADRIGQGGVLGTTQADVVSCLAAIRTEDGITDFEAETYAWGALPIEHRTTSLAEGIALELRWAAARMDECGLRR
jgi:sugar phosphate isomerase/epimerase